MRAHIEEGQLLRRRRRERTRRQARVYRVAAAMTVPSFLVESDLGGSDARYSLIVDTSLVVFHQAHFALAMELDPVLKRERTLLIDSFLHFSNSLSSVADTARIRALICELAGNPVLATGYYQEAVATTSPEAHELMTLLHSAWSAFIELGQLTRAMVLLVENAARIPKRHREELNSLVMTTIEMKREAA